MIGAEISVQPIHVLRKEFFPNSKLPALVYKTAFNLNGDAQENADYIIEVFKHNNWLNAWKNGVYDYHHYHSTTHECLGIAAGTATLMLGGPGGTIVKLDAADALIIPAGVAHKCLNASNDFLCVGAYPEGKDYDIKYGKQEEFDQAIKNIQQLYIPAYDPVFGQDALLHTFWV